MGCLDGMSCYLVGGIDRAKDDGVGWRRDLKEKALKRGLGIKFADPTDKPKSLGDEIPLEIGEEKEAVKNLKRLGKWKEALAIVHKYRRFDLRMVDTRDFIIAHIDTTIHICGTYNEVFLAEAQHKPILVIMEEPLYNIPDWLMDVVNVPDEIFSSVDACLDHLVALDNGDCELDDRWVKLLL